MFLRNDVSISPSWEYRIRTCNLHRVSVGDICMLEVRYPSLTAWLLSFGLWFLAKANISYRNQNTVQFFVQDSKAHMKITIANVG